VPEPAKAARPNSEKPARRKLPSHEPAGKSPIGGRPDKPAVARPKARPTAAVKPTDSPPAAPPAEGILESDSYLRDNPKVLR
jgi:hypothetical protein